MRATLYEALGIPQTASDEEVRASLRRLIRKYYAKTRDGQGNVEEALRFINHASRILGDHDRRVRYDQELSVSDGTTEQRIAHVVSNAMAEAGEQTDVRAPEPEAGPDDILETGLDGAEPPVDKNFHHPGLTEPVASFGRSTLMTAALCAVFGAFIAAAIVFVTPADTVLVAKQVLIWLTLTLLALTVVYATVHGVAWTRRRRAAPGEALLPETDLAILNWRRERSVFLGTNQPQEDASWIFQLRMAELERAKAGRTSEPRPWNRLAARLFDYAIWGLVLALLLFRAARSRRDAAVACVLARASAARADADHRHLGPDRDAADGRTADDARQVAVRLLSAIFDFRRVRGARHARAAPARREARVPRLVGRRRLRVSAAVADPDRGFLRNGHPESGDRLGFRRGLPRHPRSARGAQHGDRRVRPGGDALAVRRRMAPADGASPIAWVQDVGHAGTALGAVAVPRSAGRRRDSTRPGRHRRAGSAPRRRSPRAPLRGRLPSTPVDAGLRGGNRGERNAKATELKAEGPRMLQAGNWRHAAELCRAWADLELGNADAWRCLGTALEAQGHHQDAVNAFRKAKQYDPGDRTLDASIERSQKGIVADFLGIANRR